MAEFVLPGRKPDPYVRVAPAAGKEGVQGFAHPVGKARRFPSHVFRDSEALDTLKDWYASGAALRKADPALADIHPHNRALFAEQGAVGRGRGNREGRGERS